MTNELIRPRDPVAKDAAPHTQAHGLPYSGPLGPSLVDDPPAAPPGLPMQISGR